MCDLFLLRGHQMGNHAPMARDRDALAVPRDAQEFGKAHLGIRGVYLEHAKGHRLIQLVGSLPALVHARQGDLAARPNAIYASGTRPHYELPPAWPGEEAMMMAVGVIAVSARPHRRSYGSLASRKQSLTEGEAQCC